MLLILGVMIIIWIWRCWVIVKIIHRGVIIMAVKNRVTVCGASPTRMKVLHGVWLLLLCRGALVVAMVHAIERLLQRWGVVEGMRWDQLRCGRLQKLLVVFEGVSPLRWTYLTLALLVVKFELEVLKHATTLLRFVNKLPLLGRTSFSLHFGRAPSNTCEWL
jgi:hypothetical protein